MRVLIVAEGTHEREGALPELVRRLNPMVRELQCEDANWEGLPAFHGTGGGFYKRALRWLLYAKRNGFDALVLVIDQDGEPIRMRQINQAQDCVGVSDIPRALGVAIRSFDAWMLADHEALSRVLEIAVQTQRKPEGIKRPKDVCESLRDDSLKDLPLREMYEAVARLVDLDMLRKRCPLGFEPFAERVEALKH